MMCKGNLVPAVAENWQTEDKKTWIFTLRENAKMVKWRAYHCIRFLYNLGKHFLNLKAHLKIWLFMNLKNAKAVLEKRYLLNP